MGGDGVVYNVYGSVWVCRWRVRVGMDLEEAGMGFNVHPIPVQFSSAVVITQSFHE